MLPQFDFGEEPAKRKAPARRGTLSAPRDAEPSPAPVIPSLALKAAFAALPPRRVSTAEEIAARRAERRERIDREKAAGIRDARGELVGKPSAADIILRLVNRQDAKGKPLGATTQELCDALGWDAATVRGFIAAKLRKRGHDIRVSRIPGEPRRYVIGHDGATFALRTTGRAA